MRRIVRVPGLVLVCLLWFSIIIGAGMQRVPNIPVVQANLHLFNQSGGGSLALDGDGDYVEIPFAAELNYLNAMTIEAWVKRTATRCETVVGNGWLTSYWLGFCNAPIRFYHGSTQYVDGSVAIPAGTWTHIAVTYDGKTRRYYVNGQLDLETSQNSGPIAPAQDALYIGADRDGGCTDPQLCGFQGLIDEVRIWNIVRTQAEIQADMYQALDQARPGLVAVWHFDGDAQDAVGKNHGIVRGNATFSTESFPGGPATPTPTATNTPTPTSTPTPTATPTPTPPPLDPQVEALRQLEHESLQPPFARFEDGLPVFVGALVPISDNLPNDPRVQALDFLERYRALYRLSSPSSELYLRRITRDAKGGYHLFFGQQQNGIPVFAAELAVHLEGGYVTSTNGRYLSEIPWFPPPAKRAEQAQAIALNSISGKDLEPIGEPRLMYFNQAIFSGEQAKTHLAWRVRVRGLRDTDSIGTSWTVFVDAHDGQVLFLLEDVPTGDRPGEDFDIETANNTTSRSCWNLPWETADDEWFDEDGVTGGSPDADGWNAFAFAHETYHYFYDTFGRRSWDDDGEQVEVMVHVGTNWRNAIYLPGCDHLQFGDNMVTRDIFAHEFTHAVTSWTSGLVYQNQPGALDESYSDIFGALMDDDDWTMGEGSALGAIRDLSNPPAFGDPDHMSSAISGDGQGIRPPCISTCNISNDWGGVHTNSGIPNKVFYLIVEGDTHNGITVRGIGRWKAERLYYDVLTTRLTRNSQFMDARDATVEQARAYVRDGRYGFTTADVCDVINAFASVGLGDADRDCDGTPDPTDTDDDNDRILDSDDNCDGVPNPSQLDTDGDGMGDACDPDDDNDGVLDEDDNCPLTYNPNQSDDDGDGIGDVCDDDDGDGVVNPKDNCRYVPNRDQTDTDGDLLGDTCDSDDDNDGFSDETDNCPLTYNPDQTDTDGDGVGDACDLCREVADPTNADTDDDGIGDACDPDRDNDNICNEGGPLPDGTPGTSSGGCQAGPTGVDNCPLVRNPWQIDIDDNGRGLLCDEDEAAMLSGIPQREIQGVIRFLDPTNPIRIPIRPCWADGCPDYLTDEYRTEVVVGLPLDMPARIVNDRGDVVAKSGSGLEKTLRFRPDADFFYRFPSSRWQQIEDDAWQRWWGQASAYEGQHYFLEIYPNPNIDPDQEYTVEFRIATRQVTETTVYLPVVSKK